MIVLSVLAEAGVVAECDAAPAIEICTKRRVSGSKMYMLELAHEHTGFVTGDILVKRRISISFKLYCVKLSILI